MRGSRTKGYVTVAGTFAFALAIGFVMQNGDVLASRLGVDSTSKDADPRTASNYTPVTASGFVQPQVQIDDSGISTEAVGVETTPDTVIPNMNLPSADQDAQADCPISFEATPEVAAMVGLTFSAPCHPMSLVTVQHQGMKFRDMTDAQGNLSISVPALAIEAFFTATLESGTGVVAITGVPELALYDRAVLQWRGPENLQLHAYEDDAGTGEEGHIWLASVKSPAAAAAGEGGFMTPLGTAESDLPYMVQVYTYPTGMRDNHSNVALSVHAETTRANCGRKVAAQSIQIRPDHPPAARSMSLHMPSCDRVGEFLVLKNMFEDLTLAAR